MGYAGEGAATAKSAHNEQALGDPLVHPTPALPVNQPGARIPGHRAPCRGLALQPPAAEGTHTVHRRVKSAGSKQLPSARNI
jgi:hypothetical protein